MIHINPQSVLFELLRMQAENEIVEFKEAKESFSFEEIGEYFCALSNEANLNGKTEGWLVFGVRDSDHTVLGTNYRPSRPNLDSLKSEVARHTTGNLTFIEIYEVDYLEENTKKIYRVIMFQIPPACKGIPVAWKGHYYGRDGESLSALNLGEIERIRSQATREDWSSVICHDATISDLYSEAIKVARDNFKIKNRHLISEIDTWTDQIFLNKAKLTINGQITRTAILLLGKPEASHYLAPSIAKISWVLKDKTNIEKDYQHFECPFLLSLDKVFGRIRNLKYRYIKEGSLFPEKLIDTILRL